MMMAGMKKSKFESRQGEEKNMKFSVVILKLLCIFSKEEKINWNFS
jgi:hypothetical protein